MASLFFYNRKNYQWDGKRRIQREFQEQNVRLDQFKQYREDIRDLQELTCGKMDIILLLDCLMLNFIILMLIKGHYKRLEWLLWLEFMSLTSACLLLLVSAYLAMQCSVAAHSFTVRLLTQFLRLPVATTKQLNSAVAKAHDWEKSGSIMRLPFVASIGARTALNKCIVAMEEGVVDVSSLDHVKLFRRMQANFMAYDAYARAGTTLGVNQMLYGLFYKILGLSFLEDKSLVLAIGSSVIFAVLAVQLKGIDLQMARFSYVALVAPLVLAVAIMALRKQPGHELLLPFVFAMHCGWVGFLLCMLKPDRHTDIQLPTKFKQVLFLDVFGFTEKRETAPIAPVPHQSICTEREIRPSRYSRSPSDRSPRDMRSSPRDMRSPRDYPPLLSPKVRSRDSSPKVRDAAIRTPRQIRSPMTIHYEFAEALEELCDHVTAYMGENIRREFPEFYDIARVLRIDIQEWKSDNKIQQDGISFELCCDSETHSRGSLVYPDVDAWICCPADPTAYYFHCLSANVSEMLPPGAEVLPAQDQLLDKWRDVQDMWNQLMEHSFVEETIAKENDDNRRKLCSSVPAEQEGVTAQEVRFGGREGAISSFANATAAIDHTVGIGSTFYPEEMTTTPTGTVPGMIPWRLFCHACITLLCLWAIGTAWAFTRFALGKDIIYPRFMCWTRDTLSASDLCRTQVSSGSVFEFGRIVMQGSWKVASANDKWKVLGTASELYIGSGWAETELNQPIRARNVTSLAISKEKLWTLSLPSLITVYDLATLKPQWDFTLPYSVMKIFSRNNEFGIIRACSGGCSAHILNNRGEVVADYNVHVSTCTCQSQFAPEEL